MDFEDPEEDIVDMVKHSSIDDFVHTEEDVTKSVEYKSITVIDALEMANNAWTDGAPFDVDIRIIKDIVDSDPVRIVETHEIVVNDIEMYCVWGLVSVKSTDYAVPIRFYARKDALDSKVFNWSMDQPVNNICLYAIVQLFKHWENDRWSDLLSD